MPRPIHKLLIEAVCFYAAKRQNMLAEAAEFEAIITHDHIDALFYLIQDILPTADKNAGVNSDDALSFFEEAFQVAAERHFTPESGAIQ